MRHSSLIAASVLAVFAGCNSEVVQSYESSSASVGLPLCGLTTYQAEASGIYHSTGGAWDSGSSWNIWSTGYISVTHPFSAGTTTIKVRAKGEYAGGAWPHMNVYVGGTKRIDLDVSSTSFTDYTVSFSSSTADAEIKVEFTNDYYLNGADRNLIVDSIAVDTSCSPGSGGTGGTGGSSSGGSSGSTSSTCPGIGSSATTGSRTLHVATTGSSTGNGSSGSPYNTIGTAMGNAQPGDVIQVHAGTYRPTSAEWITKSGTSGSPITIRNAPGEQRPVIDGSSATFGSALIQLEGAKYIVIDGLEVKNHAAGSGINLRNVQDVTVRNVISHHNREACIAGSGTNVLIEGNECYSNVQSNNPFHNPPWGASVSTWSITDANGTSTSPSRNWTFRRNKIHDSYGECLSLLLVDGAVAEDNEIYQCYSVHLYLDHAKNATVARNRIYDTGNEYYRSLNGIGRAFGIGMAIENLPVGDSLYYALDNIKIFNNLIVSTGRAFNYWFDSSNWRGSNTYSNVSFINNVIYDPTQQAISLDTPQAGGTPTNNVMRNNVIYGGSGINIGNGGSWTISHNIFPNGVPSVATGGNNRAVGPGFVSAGSGATAPTGFKLASGSPAIDTGTSTAVTNDFFCSARGGAVSIGIHEP